MKNHQAIIIDDEFHIREAAQLLVEQNCPELHIVGTAASAAEGRKLLDQYEVDLIFLDIAMPGEDGFSFLESIPIEKYAVIFVTAYQEYALKALKANAIDYLLKPLNAIELREAVNKATAWLELRKTNKTAASTYTESVENLGKMMHSKAQSVKKITVPEQFGFQIVKVCDIMYLEADSNYTILHFSGLNKIVATRSLGDFEKILEGPDFFRIHKSTLINLRFLKAYCSYQGNFAELTDGTRLNISRRKIQEFKDAVSLISKLVE
jgi:two-component system LytT family response regulator